MAVPEGEMSFVPKVDIRETEQGYEVTAEVPGLMPEEIEVTLNGDVLILTRGRGDRGQLPSNGAAFRHLTTAVSVCRSPWTARSWPPPTMTAC